MNVCIYMCVCVYIYIYIYIYVYIYTHTDVIQKIQTDYVFSKLGIRLAFNIGHHHSWRKEKSSQINVFSFVYHKRD